MKIAVIQTCAGPDTRQNLSEACTLVNQAADSGAELAILPEMFMSRGQSRQDVALYAQHIPGAATDALAAVAKERGIWIIGGSLAELIPGSNKVYNACPIIDSSGNLVAIYRKINLFDSQVPGATLRESEFYEAGDSPIIVNINGIKVGIGICFDLRFPEMFRAYSKAGVELIALPANFTAKTGFVHWEVLLRARAIENLAYVAAPNQFGVINDGIASHGNSMIVDPWGTVITQMMEDKPGIIFAAISAHQVQHYRAQLPVL